MQLELTIRCGRYGQEARRYHLISDQPDYAICSGGEVIRTECHNCDQWMVICAIGGKLITPPWAGIIFQNRTNV